MRLTYLDEGGVSKAEPHVVVAGVIVHGDQQLVPVENYLLALVEKHIPKEDRLGFTFHATDIWSGARYFKDRSRWPLANRLEILTDLVDIPVRFGLPVTYGVAEKSSIDTITGSVPQRVSDFVYHASAFASATQRVEAYLRASAPDEYTLIIAEDRPPVRAMIKRVQASLQGRGTWHLPEEVTSTYAELPFKHIRDTLHFAGKSESPMLQIADVCAFVLRGHFSRHPKNPRLFNRLALAVLRPEFDPSSSVPA